MKEETYYRAVEYFEDGTGMALMYPKGSKNEYSRKFKSYEEAEEAVREAIYQRKNQYTYFRNTTTGEIVDKISYYNQHRLEYKIFKVIEQREELYSTDNSNVELKQADESLREEIPLTL